MARSREGLEGAPVIELVAILVLSAAGGWLAKEIARSYLERPESSADRIRRLEWELGFSDERPPGGPQSTLNVDAILREQWAKPYRVIVAEGGRWHVYGDGRRVFVKGR
jgi:hypothetical protein